jgi:hypothetical protein
MRRIVMSVLGCVMLGLAGIGCANQDGNNSPPVGSSQQSEAEMTKQAIQVVLNEHSRISETMKVKQGPDFVPSQAAQVLGAGVSQLEAIDLSRCPTDFRIAYGDYLLASRKIVQSAKQMLDGAVGFVFLGAANCLTRGELDGGYSRIQKELDCAIDQVHTAWNEVQRISTKYNAIR